MPNRITHPILTLAFLIVFWVGSVAQENNFTDKEINDIKERVNKTIKNFCQYLNEEATLPFNKNDPKDILRIHNVAKYFLTSATIEISSKNKISKANPRGIIDTIGAYEYLTRCLPNNLGRYQVVEINAIPIDTNTLKKLKCEKDKNGFTIYHGQVKYKQSFRATGMKRINEHSDFPYSFNITYVDTTYKVADIEIKKLDLPARAYWEVKIADIKVEKTY